MHFPLSKRISGPSHTQRRVRSSPQGNAKRDLALTLRREWQIQIANVCSPLTRCHKVAWEAASHSTLE